MQPSPSAPTCGLPEIGHAGDRLEQPEPLDRPAVEDDVEHPAQGVVGNLRGMGAYYVVTWVRRLNLKGMPQQGRWASLLYLVIFCRMKLPLPWLCA